MTPEKFSEWAKFHGDLFGFRDANDARLFSLWAPVLVPFTFEELREASYAVATDTRDMRRFRENHLEMLRSHVLNKRADFAAQERERRERNFASSTCPDCHGVGLMRVPHFSFITDGVLTRGFFMAVACACQMGSLRLNAINGKLTEFGREQRLLDLAQFEALVPDWREIMAAHLEADSRECEASDLARVADKSTPIDVASLAERLAKK